MLSYLPVLLFVIVGLGFGAVTIGLSTIIVPRRTTPAKEMAYECGVDPVGDARGRFSVKFYMVAVLFILFDIEVVFLWSWMTVFVNSGKEFMAFSFFEFLTYMATWILGYAYAIRVGAVDWDEAKGIEPDMLVEQDLPDELKGKEPQRSRGEASLRGHLKAGEAKEKEESGSSSYVPREPEKDQQLQAAIKYLLAPPAEPKSSAN